MMDKVAREEKEQQFKELLLQKDQERKDKLKVLKEEKKLLFPNEAKKFEISFESQTKTIAESINLIEEKRVAKGSLQEHLNCLKRDIDSLNKHLSMSQSFLTSYTVKKSFETIESFENKLKEFETELLPKKKFGFKLSDSKGVKPPKPVKDKKVSPLGDKDEVDSVSKKLMSFSVTCCGFSDRKNEQLKLCEDEINKNDVELRSLDDCTVFLFGNPSTLHISNISNCKIISGPVSTSVFIDNCSSSDIVIACQQLRIHSTKDSRFYIHVSSRVVIEDTRNVQFAPYNLEYDELQTHFNNSGLPESPNNWNLVDDFNWLVHDTPSPHWSVIIEEERVSNWTSLLNN